MLNNEFGRPGSSSLTKNSAYPFLLRERYHLLKEVGRGGFSRVFQAEDTHKSNQVVAVKQLCQSGLSPLLRYAARGSFLREASTLAHLDHPGIPHLHDQYTDGTSWYFTLDFITGETLDTYLKCRGGCLPIAETLDIGIQLCCTLNYLHSLQKPILFRDLKPDNVIRRPDGCVILVDFGLASTFTPGQIDTIALGTPGYAPSEQYPDHYGRAYTTTRSDIYSLGALLHFLLSGKDPSAQKTRFHFAPLKLQKSLPMYESTFRVLHSMLECDSMDRLGSIDEVAEELQRAYVRLGSCNLKCA